MTLSAGFEVVMCLFFWARNAWINGLLQLAGSAVRWLSLWGHNGFLACCSLWGFHGGADLSYECACSLPAFILSTRPVCTVLKHITIDMHKYAFKKWAFLSDSEFCLTHGAGAMVERGPSVHKHWLVESSAFYKCFLRRKHFLSLCLYQVVLAGVGKGCFVLGVGSGVWLTISVFWCRSNGEVWWKLCAVALGITWGFSRGFV